ncbi:MAG TPA: hypothetical protein VNM47_04825 [Terriglobia bacterium]|nr:hypothetical protein [Terriglobia bacterium]
MGSFFPQERFFNSFPALFLGSFGFVFGTFYFVFNNISGSFSKKGILFVPQFGCQIHQRIIFNRLVRNQDHFQTVSIRRPGPSDLNKKTTTLAHKSQEKSARTFLIFSPRVAAEPQLTREFERRTSLASLRFPEPGVCVFAENKAPAGDFNPRYLRIASLK